MFKPKPFRWGSYPPKWLLKEFGVALHQMGQKHQVSHAFDSGSGMTFIVMICPTDRVKALSEKVHQAYKDVWPEVEAKASPDGPLANH
jgi:hypothetical protein